MNTPSMYPSIISPSASRAPPSESLRQSDLNTKAYAMSDQRRRHLVLVHILQARSPDAQHNHRDASYGKRDVHEEGEERDEHLLPLAAEHPTGAQRVEHAEDRRGERRRQHARARSSPRSRRRLSTRRRAPNGNTHAGDTREHPETSAVLTQKLRRAASPSPLPRWNPTRTAMTIENIALIAPLHITVAVDTASSPRRRRCRGAKPAASWLAPRRAEDQGAHQGQTLLEKLELFVFAVVLQLQPAKNPGVPSYTRTCTASTRGAGGTG